MNTYKGFLTIFFLLLALTAVLSVIMGDITWLIAGVIVSVIFPGIASIITFAGRTKQV